MKAAAQAKKKNAAKWQISVREAKRLVGVLVRRSLFLELVRGSIQLHDIVRDFVLAKAEEDKQWAGTAIHFCRYKLILNDENQTSAYVCAISSFCVCMMLT